MFSLHGKTALVTGASKGIGFATAQLLRKMGAEVTIAARTAAEVKAAAEEIGATWAVADVGTADGVRAAVEAAGQVDILVSNAGGPAPGLPSEVSEDAWEAGFDVTFRSTVRLVHAVLPGMRERGWGRVIAITSQTVERPALMLPISNSMRAAVTNYLRTLAIEVGADGVTCNTVAPGSTATDRLKFLLKDEDATAAALAKVPVGRFAKPAEVGAAVAFLATDEAAFITGQEILVDGGQGI